MKVVVLIYKVPDWQDASWNCVNSLPSGCLKLRLVSTAVDCNHCHMCRLWTAGSSQVFTALKKPVSFVFSVC